MKYTKQGLSDALADLGAALGRAPRPCDLTPGMATRKTYLRWFGSWDSALEYAGYTKEPIGHNESAQETEPVIKETAPTTNEPEPALTTATRIDPFDREHVKLINLYARHVVLKNMDGIMTDELPFAGDAIAIFDHTKRAKAEIILGHLIADTHIYITEHATRLVVMCPDGEINPFPTYMPGIYYLVSRKAALAAQEIGRTTFDLIFPAFIESNKNNPQKIISKLAMLYHPRLWWINP